MSYIGTYGSFTVKEDAMEQTCKILIVDDELEFSEALKTTLEKEGYLVFTVADRDEAERAVRHQEPDMIPI